MANKRYDTYGYSPEGKRVDMYVDNGQTYLSDSTRLPSGYSVQTKGGIYKMGDSGGYRTGSHNIPAPTAPTIDKNNPLFKNLTFNSDKDYSQLGGDMYKPVYDAKIDAIRNRLNLDTQALDSQTGKIDRIHDQNIQTQNEMTERAKGDYSNQTLNRGLGRSTITTTGLASMDMANQKQVSSINESRNLALQDVHSRIQALTENANAEMSTLEGNRSIEERNLAWQLEDRDRGHWLQEAQLNAPVYQDMMRRQWDMDDRDYDNKMKQYDYDMGLERSLSQYRPGTPEYDLTNKEFSRELDKKYQLQMQDFNTSMKNELQRYIPGTDSYKVAQGQFGDMKKQMDLEYQYQSQLARLQASLSKSARSANKGTGFKQHEYAYYQNVKGGIDYIKNSGLNARDGFSELQNLKKDINSDLQFTNSTSPEMKREINALIDLEIKRNQGIIKNDNMLLNKEKLVHPNNSSSNVAPAKPKGSGYISNHRLYGNLK